MNLTRRLLLTFTAFCLLLSACADDSDDSDGTAASDQSSSSDTTASTEQTSTTGPTSSSDQTTTEASSTSAETTASSDAESTTTDVEACSASGVERPGPQADLPAAVAERREAILSAALECDLEGLAALTGPSFTASFGGDEPVELWTAQEELGTEPMRALVEILRLAPTLSEGFWVWPPAFLYETWEEVPEADRDALSALYDDDDFEDFAQFGSYIGYRASIDEAGTWTVFVAGD